MDREQGSLFYLFFEKYKQNNNSFFHQLPVEQTGSRSYGQRIKVQFTNGKQIRSTSSYINLHLQLLTTILVHFCEQNQRNFFRLDLFKSCQWEERKGGYLGDLAMDYCTTVTASAAHQTHRIKRKQVKNSFVGFSVGYLVYLKFISTLKWTRQNDFHIKQI